MKIALVIAVFAFLFSFVALAHEAPTGWSYDSECCSGQDCRAVSESAVAEDNEGFTIVKTGEFIKRSDYRVRRSQDGSIHWCSQGGAEDTSTRCLYIPDRGF